MLASNRSPTAPARHRSAAWAARAVTNACVLSLFADAIAFLMANPMPDQTAANLQRERTLLQRLRDQGPLDHAWNASAAAICLPRARAIYREDSRLAAIVEEHDDGEACSSGARKVGRDSPSFFIRLRSVLGLIPNLFAAPSGP